MSNNSRARERIERGMMENAETTRAPYVETIEVFKEMGLETPAQRTEVLARDPIAKPVPPVRYVIRLSNSSQPAPIAH
jgi:hypothetical protein